MYLDHVKHLFKPSRSSWREWHDPPSIITLKGKKRQAVNKGDYVRVEMHGGTEVFSGYRPKSDVVRRSKR